MTQKARRGLSRCFLDLKIARVIRFAAPDGIAAVFRDKF
jgi:hypothetical protein